jgi:hypothetical protein
MTALLHRSRSAPQLPSGLASTLLQVPSELVEYVAKGRIVSDSVRDQIVSVDHGRVVASETLTASGEGVVGQFAAKVHRDLAAQRQMLGASPRHEIDQPHVEIDRDRLLNGFDGDLPLSAGIRSRKASRANPIVIVQWLREDSATSRFRQPSSSRTLEKMCLATY